MIIKAKLYNSPSLVLTTVVKVYHTSYIKSKVLEVLRTYCVDQNPYQSRKTVNPAHLDRRESPGETWLQLLQKKIKTKLKVD